MSRITRSKSSTFLMELIFNLMLFCFLCSCGLLFFIKSHNMTKDTTALHQAVSLVSSVASIYESGNGHVDCIKQFYPCEAISEEEIQIYLSQDFASCDKEDASYYIAAQSADHKLTITCYKMDGTKVYELTTHHHTQTKLKEIKEVLHDD